MRSLIALSALLVLLSASSYSQAPSPNFDVSTVKPNLTNTPSIGVKLISPDGTYSARGATLKALIQDAYGVRDFQVLGGPTWVSTARWDIQAKADTSTGPMPAELFRSRLALLLEDRFHLEIHRATREMPIFELTRSKAGVKLMRSLAASGEDAKPTALMSPGELNAKRVGVPMLIQALEQFVGRTVVDKTGLAGDFDFILKWTPELGQNGPFTQGGQPAASEGPSIFTALQEQLGLKLESSRGQVSVILIDKAEEPSAN